MVAEGVAAAVPAVATVFGAVAGAALGAAVGSADREDVVEDGVDNGLAEGEADVDPVAVGEFFASPVRDDRGKAATGSDDARPSCLARMDLIRCAERKATPPATARKRRDMRNSRLGLDDRAMDPMRQPAFHQRGQRLPWDARTSPQKD